MSSAITSQVPLADGFAWRASAFGPALVCVPLEALAAHFFTTRSWALGSPTETDEARARAWHEVAETAGVADERLARLRQVHGSTVIAMPAGSPHATTPLPAADALITDDPSLAIAVQAADCVPMLMADRRTGAVGAAHAGWRGLAAGMPAAAVRAMAESFGSRPEDLIVAIGPSISAARYEVGAEVRDAFARGFNADQRAEWFPSETRSNHWLFDGWRSAADQLAAAGVPGAHIHVAGLCTATYPDLFCSYRRDGAGAGRLAAAIRARRTETD